jgi:hypothetical protein
MATTARVDSDRPTEAAKVERPPGQTRTIAPFSEVLRRALPGAGPVVRAPTRDPLGDRTKLTDCPASKEKHPRSKPADDDPDGRGLVRVEDLLDPLMRSLGTAVALGAGPVEPRSASSTVIQAELEALVSRMAKRFAWGSDGRRATARIELGTGPLAGATVLLSTEGRAVELSVELPPGTSASAWQERIERRLAERGFELTRLVVR